MKKLLIVSIFMQVNGILACEDNKSVDRGFYELAGAIHAPGDDPEGVFFVEQAFQVRLSLIFQLGYQQGLQRVAYDLFSQRLAFYAHPEEKQAFLNGYNAGLLDSIMDDEA
jgi:hypothetical protein